MTGPRAKMWGYPYVERRPSRTSAALPASAVLVHRLPAGAHGVDEVVHVFRVGHHSATGWKMAFWALYGAGAAGLLIWTRGVRPIRSLRRPYSCCPVAEQTRRRRRVAGLDLSNTIRDYAIAAYRGEE